MQNRYAGDIGDYGKLGLLRALHTEGLSVGVNWYLVPDENHNKDGRYVQYLSNETYRYCDEPLWLTLKHIVESEQRTVASLENGNILQAAFFSKPLAFQGKPRPEREQVRKRWHGEALTCLADADIVFVDPDNGLMVPSAAGTPKANKYVLVQELADYYAQGASVVYYQHKARKRDVFYIEQHQRLLECDDFGGATGFGLKFLPTSQRYYFFILQHRHRPIVQNCVENMSGNAWKDFFYRLADYAGHEEYTQTNAAHQFMYEMNRGMRVGEEQGWLTAGQVRTRLGERHDTL